MWSIIPSSGQWDVSRDVVRHVPRHVSRLPVPQADVPGGNPQEVVVSGLQVSLQRADSNPESQSQCSDLQTSTKFPAVQQQEEHAEPQPGRRYWQGHIVWCWFCSLVNVAGQVSSRCQK